MFKKMDYFGVSPGGIVEIELHTSKYFICFVEIETRVAENTLDKIIAAVIKYSYIIFCTYGDELF